MSRIHYIIMGLLLIGISACSGTNQGDVGSEETTVQTEAVENDMETASDQEIEAPRKEEARTVSKPAPVKPKPVTTESFDQNAFNKNECSIKR